MNIEVNKYNWFFVIIFFSFKPDQRPLFPVIFNLAAHSRVWTNATCGMERPEVYCRLVEHVLMKYEQNSNNLVSPSIKYSLSGISSLLYSVLHNVFLVRPPQCGICDAHSTDLSQSHIAENAIDGSPRWWQSPTVANGNEFERVTIIIDMRAVRIYFRKWW